MVAGHAKVRGRCVGFDHPMNLTNDKFIDIDARIGEARWLRSKTRSASR
jgi:hypothetical protein